MRNCFFIGVNMENTLKTVNAIIWGIPVLSFILIIGLYLSVSSDFIQFRWFRYAIKKFLNSLRDKNHAKEGISGYRALCTALAATVGTGNIAGVAGAIAIGGPGTIFWMWICAFLGMVTKFAEVTLAQRYRVKNHDGESMGGPMYMIQLGLTKKYHFLAYIYCFFCIIASFGVGNATQVNTVMDSIKSIAAFVNLKIDLRGLLVLGVIIAFLINRAFRNGVNGVGNWAEKLVPLASVVYILLCFVVLLLCFDKIPYALSMIIYGAFSPKSASCGIIGSAFLTLRVGASRGVFTNEAGMGTASIAHASADVDHPVEQGLMGIIEVFLDTIVICSLTAMVILCSGVDIPYGTDPGITLTIDAFSVALGGWCRFLITGLVCIFAFATILGWGVYGLRCAQYLFGGSVGTAYIFCQSCAVLLGILLNTSVVWLLAEIVNGLMAIPNLLVLFALSPEFLRITHAYQREKRTV